MHKLFWATLAAILTVGLSANAAHAAALPFDPADDNGARSHSAL
jgi:hypothetical protein